jgi:4-amino-4-deoxy-L-arabinose transferase-like glycosyltransferase
MAAHHEWMTPLIFGQPQFEKPPLTYWLIEFAFNTWGESPVTARLFPALFAIIGVMALYWLGLMGFKDELKAFLSSLVLATAAFYAVMGKMVFTDMIFTVFILCAFAMFVWAYTDRRMQAPGLIGFYVFCGLSILTKGPLGFAILHIAVVLFLLYRREIKFLNNWGVPAGLLLCVAIALPWYVYTYKQYGHAFTHEFFYNDHWRRLVSAEHRANDHWFFYPMTMLAGLFPWTLFLGAAFVDLFKRLKSTVSIIDYLSLSWIIAVLIVFQFAHSKLTSYILPLFPALALMTGNFLGNSLTQIQRRRGLQNALYATFAIVALLGVAVMAAQKVCHHYLTSLMPVYFLSGSLIALAGMGAALTLKDRLQTAVYVVALVLCPIFLSAFMIRTDIEGYVSSHEASEYLPPSTRPVTVLTSKNNARGIRYFTGQDVAVVESSPNPFFSPHPVPILNTNAKILELLKSQPVTYGVIRKNAYKNILTLCTGRYHVALLRTIGVDYVVRIEALKHS